MISKIKSFLLSFAFVRFLHLLYKNCVFYLKYTLSILLLLFFLAVIYLTIFNPNQLKKLANKTADIFVDYSFQLTNVDQDFDGKINVKGIFHSNADQLNTVIAQTIAENKSAEYKDLINRIKEEIKKLPWISDVVVSRSLPNDLNINITEYQPFAIWEDNNIRYIIDKDGKKITSENLDEFSHLLILSGDGANYNAKSLFNILAIDPEISRDIYSAVWISGRRWNIIFNNDLLVKLPENNISAAWSRLIKIYKTPGSLINLKSIDLRIDDKIYLEYLDHDIQELRKL